MNCAWEEDSCTTCKFVYKSLVKSLEAAMFYGIQYWAIQILCRIKQCQQSFDTVGSQVSLSTHVTGIKQIIQQDFFKLWDLNESVCNDQGKLEEEQAKYQRRHQERLQKKRLQQKAEYKLGMEGLPWPCHHGTWSKAIRTRWWRNHLESTD